MWSVCEVCPNMILFVLTSWDCVECMEACFWVFLTKRWDFKMQGMKDCLESIGISL